MGIGHCTNHVRPRLHFTANCWINDPCAPGYDSKTSTYHLFYQCNPQGTVWGNMSWGHVVSKDMLRWEHISDHPALSPDQVYDCKGVFTGCWMPFQPSDQLTVVYSSIKQLPFHWSTPPYPRNAAGLAMATSRDGGRTWKKDHRNPFLEGEPDAVSVTGFRDPYVARWPAMAALRGSDPAALYAVVSGGIQDAGPTSFLYEISLKDPNAWRFLGPLVEMPLRFQPSCHWSGNYGMNWECVNFIPLSSGNLAREFLIIGAEGDVEKQHVAEHSLPSQLPARTVRTQVWMSGILVQSNDGIRMQYRSGGFLDHGPYYAANSFQDPTTGRRIVYGWIPEEDIPAERASKKGWSGCLAIPREVFLLRIPGVAKALRSQLSEIASCELHQESDGSQSLITLGIRPIEETRRWRETCAHPQHLQGISLPFSSGSEHQSLFWASQSAWEMETTVSVRPGCETVGVDVRHDRDRNQYTTIRFSVTGETIVVDRSHSSPDTWTNKCPDAGPFTLFTSFQGGTLEQLRLRIFSDGDVLEVFANDRFALATMVYADSNPATTAAAAAAAATTAGGITAFATGTPGSVTFDRVSFWDGIGTNHHHHHHHLVNEPTEPGRGAPDS